jgi:hypothetical protein
MPATELADRKAEYYFLAYAWRITPQLPSLRIRAWRERMSGNALARACMVSVPWSCQVDASVSIVVSHPRSHDRRCGVDPTTVPPAPPLSPSSPQNLAYAFERSRERRGGTVAPRAQRTLGAARPPLGLLSCGCLEDGVTIHMGSSDRATRGHLRPSLPVGSFAYAFTDRRLLCSKHWCSQPRFGAVLDGGFAAARKYAGGPPTTFTGSTTAKSGRNIRLGSTVLDRTRAL